MVELHRLDSSTILKWTTAKSKVSEKASRNKSQETETRVPKTNEANGDRFYCDLCPNWFPAKGSLKKHMYCHRSTTKNSNEIKNGEKCPFCFKNVAAEKLRSHVNNHKQLLNKRTCPVCGLKITNTHLKRHILTHEQHRCRKCKKVFDSDLKLKK